VQVIVGIGVNVHMTRAELVDQPWTSLAAAFPDRSWGRNQLAAALIQAVQACTSVFARQGFHAFRPAWQARDIHFGKSLRARQGQLEGVGAGIDDAGNYLLRTDDGLVPVRSGEISLRVVS
jgi:BirA family biotin operon repressor/biotin-[acetyl-CoA-carboxylase] ligase